MLGDFLTGAGYLLRGFRLIARPGLRRFVVIPLFINVIVFVVLGFAGVQAFDWLLAQLLPQGDAFWIELVRGVLWLLFAAVALLILVFTFSVVANLIAAPFNGLLSARVEQSLRGRAAPESGRGVLGEAMAAIGGEVRKFLYFLLLLVAGLALTLLPVVNIISPVVWALITVWMLALEYTAYPMENRGMRFVRMRQVVRARRATALGFGGAVMLAMMVPGVNLMVMPAAVCGATALWIERLSAAAGGTAST